MPAAVRLTLGALVAVLLILSGGAEEASIDRILVEKSQRRMDLMSGDRVVRSYQIALGSTPQGDKQQEGDGKTPEGKYVIEGRNPSSAFHLSLKISYPDATDRAEAAARGVSPGGNIFIHGAPNWWQLPGQPPGDWTLGCIAVTKAEIEEIWRLLPDGTPVEIKP
ncbi:MAG TPA: L,D-transpeptidase family protein [Dongiaceae bacterium]|nr:L,D-transpeptidase family protein [Dongiaceae bacterium]